MSLPQASNKEETYIITKKYFKTLKEDEGHDHWHSRHIVFGIIYKSQNGRNNDGEI